MKISGLKQKATLELEFAWPVLPDLELNQEELLVFINQAIADKLQLVIHRAGELSFEVSLQAKFSNLKLHGD